MNQASNIHYCKSDKTFHLKSKDVSYIIKVDKYGYINHLYWGERIEFHNSLELNGYMERPFSPNPILNDRSYSLDTICSEYPTYGNTDFRTPAIQIEYLDGSRITDLKYHDHIIFMGKKKIDGLPSTYVKDDADAETLEIVLKDSQSDIFVILSYTIFNNYNAITRSVRVTNLMDEDIKLLRTYSASVDFDDHDFSLLHLSGSWARERHIAKKKLSHGRYVVESRRGSSSHQQNPFVALLRSNSNEDQGDVYGFSFVYSGNFVADVEVDQYSKTRVGVGISPFEFKWKLAPNESFQTPEVVMVYSNMGLGDMSRTYHDLYRNQLCRGPRKDQERPILINNWEATYFDFDEGKIVSLAEEAKEYGIELFVLDDGWFGKRDDDKSSLGDWFPDKSKLPNGLNGIIKEVNKFGMEFGIWVEPEMISKESKLFEEHPDYFIAVNNRESSEGRNQLVLDLTQREVCDYLISVLSRLFSNHNISYVKWDMNRNMTEVGSLKLGTEHQQEVFHRYILGLYYVLENLTKMFPRILFESCSGGGGRFDPGMLYYMPQTWTSDDTDAYERQKIQYGTSIVYPLVSMGSHVSDVPNHQVFRTTPIETRGHVAFAGNLGYELDLKKQTELTKKIVKEQVKFYKSIRHIIHYGDFYRLLNPFKNNDTSWIVVSKDKREACFFYYQGLDVPNGPEKRVKMKGLDREKLYWIDELETSKYGDELMKYGLKLQAMRGDFESTVLYLKCDE